MITIVSGLPRSGTSLMMRILEQGGMPVLVDQKRKSDEDNPKGYYEFERVKKLPEDTSWLPEAKGKAVKMVSMLLPKLPQHDRYKVIFMRRNMDEIIASQNKMLLRNKKNRVGDDEEMQKLFEGHLRDIQLWMKSQPNMEVLEVWYNALLEDPEKEIEKIRSFLGIPLNASLMREAIDKSLYRNRRHGLRDQEAL